MVKLGLTMDLRNPACWHSDPARVYGFAPEVCAEADRLGVHSLCTTEHHGFDDGYLPRPLIFAAAIAARTKRARIGTAVVVAPLHNPMTIAEEAAVVDLISAGRLELGLGAGQRALEFELHARPMADRRERMFSCVEELRELWNSGRITPAPVQREVPIWLGLRGPQGARRAGALSAGLLSADPALAASYREGLAAAGHRADEARMAGFLSFYVSDDPERDWPIIAERWSYQWDSYARHADSAIATAPPVGAERARRAGVGPAPTHLLVATPEAAAEAIAEATVGAPIETVYTFASLPGLPEDMVERHLRLLATQFAPRWAELTSDRSVRGQRAS
jgi:alkanesulfonate monooxygenase SsuD/methylene tetrahydromethanopterin reductase-like flavin-dependent oxidoreductase (luciferase family)